MFLSNSFPLAKAMESDSDSEEMHITTDSNPITMTRVILQSEHNHPEATGDFTLILSSIQLACKAVAQAVQKVGMVGTLQPNTNYRAELNLVANEAFLQYLKFCKKIAALVSEESKEIYITNASEGKCKRYADVIAFDPLDGVDNLQVNVPCGSVFGIWRRADPSTPGSSTDFLVPGYTISAAGYCCYGCSTMMVLALGDGYVDGFTLDPGLGEFILTHPNMLVPSKGRYYSVNEGNSTYWDEATAAFVNSRKFPTRGYPCDLRYIGSVVADIHRIMIDGGVFLYPGDRNKPNGKLGALYKAFPMSFIVEQAGGKAISGVSRALSHIPRSIHETIGVVLGSASDVSEAEECYRKLKCISSRA